MADMKGYGFKGSMNPQKTMKKGMMSSKSYKNDYKKDMMSSKSYKGKDGYNMSPPIKMTEGQPIWQNMR